MNIPKEQVIPMWHDSNQDIHAFAQRVAEYGWNECMKLWALSQPVSMEPDWKRLYELEKKKKQAIYDKYERDIAKLPRIVPMDAASEPVSMEPVAWMCSNQELVHKGYQRFAATPGGDWNISVYTAAQLAAARQQGAEEVQPHALKEKLRSAEQRIAELEKSNAVLLEALKQIEVTGPDDDEIVWINLHGHGTTGKAILRVGKQGLIAAQVARLFEEDRRTAIAEVKP